MNESIRTAYNEAQSAIKEALIKMGDFGSLMESDEDFFGVWDGSTMEEYFEHAANHLMEASGYMNGVFSPTHFGQGVIG
jgi:hypothetical protein